METIYLEDTEVVRYDPETRIAVIICDILPHIMARKNVSVLAVAKLEAKCWLLASKLKLSDETLQQIWNAFRGLGKKGYDDRYDIWDILRERRLRQTKLEDWMVSYG